MTTIEQDTANLRHTASGGNYDDSAASTLTVTVRDNDAPLTFPDTSTIPPFTFTVGQEVSSLPLPGAIGGMPPLTYSLKPLPLPDGLDFTADTRTLAGIPSTETAAVTLTYTVTDSAPMPTTAALTFTVTVNPAPTLESISNPPTYLVGRTVLLPLPEASDGTAPFSYKLARLGSGSPTLPPGLTFNKNARPPTITGTPDCGVRSRLSALHRRRQKPADRLSGLYVRGRCHRSGYPDWGISGCRKRADYRQMESIIGRRHWRQMPSMHTSPAPLRQEVGNTFSLYRINDATATSCIIDSLSNGTEYSVTVVARNLGGTEGNSAPSIPIMATPAPAVLFRIKVFLEGAQ